MGIGYRVSKDVVEGGVQPEGPKISCVESGNDEWKRGEERSERGVKESLLLQVVSSLLLLLELKTK